MKPQKAVKLTPGIAKILKALIGLKHGRDVIPWIEGAKSALQERANLLRFTELYREAHVLMDRLGVRSNDDMTLPDRIRVMEAERIGLVEFLNKRGIKQMEGGKPVPLVTRIMRFTDRQVAAILAMNNPKVGDYRVRKYDECEHVVEQYQAWEHREWFTIKRGFNWYELDVRGKRGWWLSPGQVYQNDALAWAAVEKFRERDKTHKAMNRPSGGGYQPRNSETQSAPPQGGSGVPPKHPHEYLNEMAASTSCQTLRAPSQRLRPRCQCSGDRAWDSATKSCLACGGRVEA
jgi:hypothetical protein